MMADIDLTMKYFLEEFGKLLVIYDWDHLLLVQYQSLK
jgi:hypothetical protein